MDDINVYAFASSDVGRKREKNQDSYLIANDLAQARLYAVADGMGGHKGGEVASDLCVRAMDQHVRFHGARLGADLMEDARVLAESVQRANALIHATSCADPNLSGMGTTATGLLIAKGRAVIAHVGDSRIYLVRGERITQLSDDHSFVWQQMKAGLLTPEQAKRSPFKNHIMRSVGVEREVQIDVITLDTEPGDVFVMCSDGLCGVVEDDEINAIVNDNFLHRVPDLLIDLANERGGPDNITVLVAYALG